MLLLIIKKSPVFGNLVVLKLFGSLVILKLITLAVIFEVSLDNSKAVPNHVGGGGDLQH